MFRQVFFLPLSLCAWITPPGVFIAWLVPLLLDIFKSSVQSPCPCYQCRLGLRETLPQVWRTCTLASCGSWLNCDFRNVSLECLQWLLFLLCGFHSSGRIQRWGDICQVTGTEGGQGGVSTLTANVWETVTENLVRCYRLNSQLGGQQKSYLGKNISTKA